MGHLAVTIPLTLLAGERHSSERRAKERGNDEHHPGEGAARKLIFPGREHSGRRVQQIATNSDPPPQSACIAVRQQHPQAKSHVASAEEPGHIRSVRVALRTEPQ